MRAERQRRRLCTLETAEDRDLAIFPKSSSPERRSHPSRTEPS